MGVLREFWCYTLGMVYSAFVGGLEHDANPGLGSFMSF